MIICAVGALLVGIIYDITNKSWIYVSRETFIHDFILYYIVFHVKHLDPICSENNRETFYVYRCETLKKRHLINKNTYKIAVKQVIFRYK